MDQYQDGRDVPAPPRQYATTLHAPPVNGVDPKIVEIPTPTTGPPFELEGLQHVDQAGNLIYLWSRPDPDANPEGDGKPVVLPLVVLQALSIALCQELADRLTTQWSSAQQSASQGIGEGGRFLDGQGVAFTRARRVVETLAKLIEAGELPDRLKALAGKQEG